MGLGSSAGCGGIIGIVAGFLVVSAIITLVTGTYVHWLFVVLGIVVGLSAVQSINR